MYVNKNQRAYANSRSIRQAIYGQQIQIPIEMLLQSSLVSMEMDMPNTIHLIMIN